MRSRLSVVFLAGALWVGLIALRLYELQVVRHVGYMHKARQQQQRVITLDPPRGTIYDAAGRELAVSVQVESVYAVPSEIADRAATARAIANAVGGLDPGRLERLLAEDREYLCVAHKLDPPATAALRRLRLAGIHFVPESKRYYPMRGLGAQVLGFVGFDNHGLAGLEQIFDDVITGKPGVRTVLRDARRGTAVSPDLLFAEPEPGQDLVLTLDAAVQHIVERELARVVEERGARTGSAVFLDPESGAILAMASYPSFDPNEFGRYPPSAWRNRTITDAYEPGSTFKVITAAAALESGLVRSDDLFDCGMGGITLSGILIRDHKRYGLMTFADVIAKSSNVGVIRAALQIGSARLYGTIVGFGFGRPSGIDLPGESPGILHPLERWGPLTKAYVSFGQGVSVTPLQLAVAVAAVANGGKLLRPYVLAGVRKGDTLVPRHLSPVVVERPISAATAAEVRRLLERVVTSGTGKGAAVAGYRVAGKTGTAQIPVAGGYARHAYLPSFVGFAPADRPVLVGVVAVDEPQGAAYYGAQVAAPVFGRLVREVLLYRGVRPERQPLVEWPGEVVTASLPHAPAASSGSAAGGVRAAAVAARGEAAMALNRASISNSADSANGANGADDESAGEDLPELWRGQGVASAAIPAPPAAATGPSRPVRRAIVLGPSRAPAVPVPSAAPAGSRSALPAAVQPGTATPAPPAAPAGTPPAQPSAQPSGNRGGFVRGCDAA
ncbi:MAG TPA: penicillin-binding transpeptidase domain-containing protein [Thermoanaerobaculia bacterium]|nr:penicillin-binding transpeptidase domain-containing protein [Thermoanaerobaculia bacterium]